MKLGVHYIDFLPGAPEQLAPTLAATAKAAEDSSTLEELPHKLDVLRRHCDSVGRDFSDIRLTAGYFDDPFADVDGYLRTLDQYAALGIHTINTGPWPGIADPTDWVKRLGDEVIPRLPS